MNSEAWVNYTENDVRILEQCDEILHTRILDCESNTSNTLKYFELGVLPIRYEVMKRKLSFLQYLLKEDKESMISQILKVTQENPLKNDFVLTCKKYMKILGIEFTFEEIEKMTKASFKKVLKEKTRQAAFKYLIGQKLK